MLNQILKIDHKNSIENVKFNNAFNLNSAYNKQNYEEYFGNLIHKTAIVNWDRVIIGKGNVIGPYSCIGTEPPNILENSDGLINIGNQNLICEYVTIHLPTKKEFGTLIGDNNILMSSCHVGHDCIIGDDNVLCNNSAIAGHSRIMRGVTLALNSSIHQFKIIGSWSMIGMNSCANKSILVEPGNIFFGVPSQNMGKNIVGLRRHKITKDKLSKENEYFNQLICDHNYI
ncbi:MAG: hypothetical protein CBB97_25730 [Candidatus Endolissoclinum sp. TMED37]|nr:MAG: hypothetical protein CBB97_25730 [Candidatus Endolissoclinum sp. TMED37]|tara:strand:+ start:188 stop:874 length:687 start_codon:yes stop_codon:yes gene_type:complete